MTKRPLTKLIHVGQYAAEVDVELIDADKGWSPLSVVGRRCEARRSEEGIAE